MKKLSALVVLFASSMALTACGGGSSDSSGSVNSTFSSTLANGNVYSCPTKVALDSCKGDSSCQVAKCTITKQVVKPIDPTSTTVCEVSNNVVYARNGATCKYIDTTKDANVTVACDSNKLYIDGNIGRFFSTASTYSSPYNINGVNFVCK
ncbi:MULTISPECIES: hypothetical protein [unclassified Moraxella]|uniref:hypothetical protein n=1 Tax=unclassified Moraxella TaxID=2685852 RepID=UPI003AF6147F